MHVASSQIVCLWLSVKVISGSTALFESRIIDCSQEETFGNLLSRLSSQRVGKCGFFFLPATQVYFVIKLARATKHQVVKPEYQEGQEWLHGDGLNKARLVHKTRSL